MVTKILLHNVRRIISFCSCLLGYHLGYLLFFFIYASFINSFWGPYIPLSIQRETTHWDSHLSCRLAGRPVLGLNRRSQEAPGSCHQPCAACKEPHASEYPLRRSWNTGEGRKVNPMQASGVFKCQFLPLPSLSKEWKKEKQNKTKPRKRRKTRNQTKGFCFFSLK